MRRHLLWLRLVYKTVKWGANWIRRFFCCRKFKFVRMTKIRVIMTLPLWKCRGVGIAVNLLQRCYLTNKDILGPWILPHQLEKSSTCLRFVDRTQIMTIEMSSNKSIDWSGNNRGCKSKEEDKPLLPIASNSCKKCFSTHYEKLDISSLSLGLIKAKEYNKKAQPIIKAQLINKV